MNMVTQVREFTTAASLVELPVVPQRMSAEAVNFIRSMIEDELDELDEATTCVDQADALVDIIYYIGDCAVRQGMNLDKLFGIVHAANMQKVVDGKVTRREDGKILKPEGWEPPQPKLVEELNRQTREGSWTSENTDTLTASEAIYGFCAWLTSNREEIKMGSSQNCATIPPLIKEFCEVNKLIEPREGWHNNLIHPSGQCSGV